MDLAERTTEPCEVNRCSHWPTFPVPIDDDTNVYMCWRHMEEYRDHAGFTWYPEPSHIAALSLVEFKRYLAESDYATRLAERATEDDRLAR